LNDPSHTHFSFDIKGNLYLWNKEGISPRKSLLNWLKFKLDAQPIRLASVFDSNSLFARLRPLLSFASLPVPSAATSVPSFPMMISQFDLSHEARDQLQRIMMGRKLRARFPLICGASASILSAMSDAAPHVFPTLNKWLDELQYFVSDVFFDTRTTLVMFYMGFLAGWAFNMLFFQFMPIIPLQTSLLRNLTLRPTPTIPDMIADQQRSIFALLDPAARHNPHYVALDNYLKTQLRDFEISRTSSSPSSLDALPSSSSSSSTVPGAKGVWMSVAVFGDIRCSLEPARPAFLKNQWFYRYGPVEKHEDDKYVQEDSASPQNN